MPNCPGLTERVGWSAEEENTLINLHNKWGNRWTDISNQLSGKYFNSLFRDHNSVKNHFYAQLRKGIRRINWILKAHFNGHLKQLNMAHVSKMITLLSEKSYSQEQLDAVSLDLTEGVIGIDHLMQLSKRRSLNILIYLKVQSWQRRKFRSLKS